MSGDELAIQQFVTGAVHATVADRDVHLKISTDYPVIGEVTVRVVAGGGGWTLGLRVPSWCEGTTARVGGQSVEVAADAPKVPISCTQADGHVVTLSLPMPARFTWPDPRLRCGVRSPWSGVRSCTAWSRLVSVPTWRNP